MALPRKKQLCPTAVVGGQPDGTYKARQSPVRMKSKTGARSVPASGAEAAPGAGLHPWVCRAGGGHKSLASAYLGGKI
jgi:hypothetical protein